MYDGKVSDRSLGLSYIKLESIKEVLGWVVAGACAGENPEKTEKSVKSELRLKTESNYQN